MQADACASITAILEHLVRVSVTLSLQNLSESKLLWAPLLQKCLNMWCVFLLRCRCKTFQNPSCCGGLYYRKVWTFKLDAWVPIQPWEASLTFARIVTVTETSSESTSLRYRIRMFSFCCCFVLHFISILIVSLVAGHPRCAPIAQEMVCKAN